MTGEWMVENQGNRKAQQGSQGSSNLRRLTSVLVASLFGLLLSVLVAGAQENGSLKERVMHTVDSVMGILSEQQLKTQDRVEERRQFVKQAVNRLFDYEEMGKRTLGVQWQNLTTAEQEEFVDLFQQFLSNSYESRFEKYSDEHVQYLGERQKGDFAEVRTVLKSNKVQVPLDFRLLWKSGQWWAYDLVIDGISLVKNFRAQFARIIQTSSYKGLREKLKTKTDLINDVVLAR
jgi:phospholipid transport system substrate-binding protein